MATIQELKKAKYIVWLKFEDKGWQPYPAESADEIIDILQRYNIDEYMITKNVTLSVVESSDE